MSDPGPPQVARAGSDADRPPAAAPAAPSPAAQPPPLWSRLHDPEGPIAGLPGYALRRAADPSRCGGIRIVTTRGTGKPSPADQPFVEVLALEFPTGLDFTDAHRQQSTRKFQAWISQLETTARSASKHYEDEIAHGAAPAKLAGAARIAQIDFRLASLLARAEIPADVASGPYASDKVKAYCDQLATFAEPLQARAEEAARACAGKLATLKTPGWWTAVCVP